MSKFRHKIALIVPTRNRPRILERLLKSLEAQTVQADQVIIVDGSDQPIESEIKPFLNSVFSYMRVYPPSLTKQRNKGLKAVNDGITLVGYLDDDIIMERDAVEEMLRFWESCPEEIGGASFNIINSTPVKATWLTKLFLLNDGNKGRVLRSGNNTGVAPVLENIYTQWLCGGATVWRKNIFEKFQYDEWYRGWAYLEDLDFSYSVSKKYGLAVVHPAKVQHFPPPLKPQKMSSFIKMHVVQQHYFVKKHKELSLPLFYWSIIGNIFIVLLGGARRFRIDNFPLAWGYISGLLNVITGNLNQVDEGFREEDNS